MIDLNHINVFMNNENMQDIAEVRTDNKSGLFFDPFAIKSNHSKHSESTSIIELEESGRVFCPLCLEQIPTEDLEKIDPALFNLYVFNLFEALDQHGETIKVRKIALTVLDFLLKKKPIRLESDLKFHNLLRTIYKVMDSDMFDCVEFNFIAKIFSNISGYFIDSNPLPLISVWRASEKLLNQATKRLRSSTYKKGCKESGSTPYILFGSLALIIKTYLKLLRRFAADQVSDMIFPISENDTLITHNRNYYITSQVDCLRFMTDTLIAECWPLLIVVDTLVEAEKNFMACEMFESLGECFESAIRINNQNFLETVQELDCIQFAHSVIVSHKNDGGDNGIKLITKIRSYLGKFVYHYIEKYFETDEHLRDFASNQNVVETNHRNAKEAAKNSDWCKRTVFYLMVNVVAARQQSKYFNPNRIKKVLQSIEPNNLDIRNSFVFMRVFCYLAAMIIEEKSEYEKVINFISQTWRDSDARENLMKIYCFDDTILRWVYRDSEFQKLVTVDTIKYIVEQSAKRGYFERNIYLLIDINCYKHLLQVYLSNEETASMMIEQVLLTDQPGAMAYEVHHRAIVDMLSAILPALLHDAILDLDNQFYNIGGIPKIKRLLIMNVSMLSGCKHFNVILDEQFIIDLFRLIERMYGSETNDFDELLTIFNEFITLMIETNNEASMRVIKYLNFNAMGYMFHLLNNSPRKDNFIESIARIFVAYDHIDYPLANNLVNDLFPTAMSVVNWMMSQSKDLQFLALRFTPKVLKMELNRTTTACITSGLAHMLYKSPDLVRKKADCNSIVSIIKLESFKYNPLVRHIAHKLPETLRQEILGSQEYSEEISNSPMSFGSSENSIFEEEHISVSRILTRLNEQDRLDSSLRIPDTLFVSRAVEDQHLSSFDIDDWTRRALNST